MGFKGRVDKERNFYLTAFKPGPVSFAENSGFLDTRPPKDLDLLDSPTHRRKLASPRRGRDPAAVGTSTAAEEVEPMAKARKGGTK